MAGAPTTTLQGHSGSQQDAVAILNALANPVFVIDGTDHFTYLNHAGEQFFEASAQSLVGRPLGNNLPADSPVFALIAQVRLGGHSVTEFGVTIETPRIGSRLVAVNAAPVAEHPGEVVLSLQERSIASKIDRQLTHRSAARSVTAMAAMLAHELKNPLSGIRGAAQLLEPGVSDGDRELTQLICDETDRIVALVDRMELFSDDRPIERGPVNIHEVLEHVRKLATSGFARKLDFVESYDPSLPPVYGNRDMLVQVLLNLIKNAAEAMTAEGGEIRLSTRYSHGVRLAVPGIKNRVVLPIRVSVGDNGPGIAEDLRAHLFDAFVTTKAGGKGLGLALVAKIVGDHGGVIEFASAPRRTEFRVMLPVVSDGTGSK
jgi:two-component system nitrogen regulation sensor histidine kinase GlnL